MRYIIAIDSFKGSLTSLEAGEAAGKGVMAADENAPEIIVFPVADGGEGTVDALIFRGGVKKTVRATMADGTKGDAYYGVMKDGTAVIEIAAAAGLPGVPADKRDPRYTTTYGVGELIHAALNDGCRKFIIALGGSATNDGGAGMLTALGIRLTDENGGGIPFGNAGLDALRHIDMTNADERLRECDFRVACDVNNPLCGENGCTYVFAPQKGAKPEHLAAMDAALGKYAALVGKVLPNADATTPGSGAAGGLGFAFMTFLNGKMTRGIELVMRENGLYDALCGEDALVLTGEGRLDAQTAMGKAPCGIASAAKAHGKTVFAFAGSVADSAHALHSVGIDAYFPILRGICTLEDAMRHDVAANNLTLTVEEAVRACRSASRT